MHGFLSVLNSKEGNEVGVNPVPMALSSLAGNSVRNRIEKGRNSI